MKALKIAAAGFGAVGFAVTCIAFPVVPMIMGVVLLLVLAVAVTAQMIWGKE